MVGRHKREEKQSLGSAQGGHSYAPLQNHNVLMRSVPRSQHNPCPTELTTCARKHDKVEKRMVGRHNREDK